MNTVPERHRAVAHAWVDGAEIEYQTTGGRWFRCDGPYFRDTLEYRVKPKPPIVRWKWLLQNGDDFEVSSMYYSKEEIARVPAEMFRGYHVLHFIPESEKEFPE